MNVTNTNATGYASHYLDAAGVIGQIYTGGGVMVIATNTNHALQFYTNRFVNLKSLSIEASGAVVCSTSFTNNSDTKLKDNQQIANLDEIQNISDKINVKT